MKNKGLGRGLDAIFGQDLPVGPPLRPMSAMREIELERIAPNPTQPRRHFDTDALEELADSIRTLGVIQPVTVRPEGDRYILVSGERRWRAAQLAGLDAIPAYIRDVDDADLHAMALVENIQREDLNPIEIALSMQRLIDECGLRQDGLSEKLGVKRSTIANYLRLLRLPDEIQLSLKEGVISMGHAKAIAGAATEDQLHLLRRCVRHGLSVRQTEEWVRNRAAVPTEAAPSTDDAAVPSPHDDEAYSRRLGTLLECPVSIRRARSGGARITISLGEEELKQLVERLESRMH